MASPTHRQILLMSLSLLALSVCSAHAATIRLPTRRHDQAAHTG